MSSSLSARAIWEQTKAQAALLAKNPVTWCIAATAGIVLLNKKINDNIESLKEQKELLEETENNISNYDSEISEKESKKDANLETIDKLKASNNNIDNDKITRLENENSLLEQQIQTLETLKKQEKEVAEQVTLDILNNTSEITKLTQVWEDLKSFDILGALKDSNHSVGAVINSKEMWEDGDYLDAAINLAKGAATTFIPIAGIIDWLKPKKENEQSITEETSEQIEKVKNLRNELSDLEMQKNSMSKKDYEKKHNKLTDNISAETDKLSDNIQELQTYQSTLDTSDPIQLEKFKEVQNVMDDYTASMALLDDYNTFDKIINSDIYGKDKEELIELAKQGKLTEEVLGNKYHNLSVLFKALGYDIDDVTSKLRKLENKQSTTDNEIPTPNSFTEAWASLGKESDEETAKTSQALKEELLSLANAGKLTEKTFNQTTGAKSWLKQLEDMGLSVEYVIEKINKLQSVSSANQLASMKTGISSISSILGEKETGKTGIGADTLAGMPDEVKKCTREYNKFCRVLGNGKSKMSQCREAANELATAYVNSNNFLSKLTDKNKGYYISVLEEMGVENAAAIVTDELAKQKGLAAIETANLSNMNVNEINMLIEEKVKTDENTVAQINLIYLLLIFYYAHLKQLITSTKRV